MLDGQISQANSSQVPLLANSVFEGLYEDVSNFDAVTVSVYADGAPAVAGLQFMWSMDGAFDEITQQFTFALDTAPDGFAYGRAYTIPVQAQYFRARYVNGPFDQSFFRFQTIYRFVASDEPRSRIAETLSDSDLASNVKATLWGHDDTLVGPSLAPIHTISVGSGASIPTPLQGIPVVAAMVGQTGTSGGAKTLSYLRMANVFKPLSALAISAEQTVWTPATGKKVRYLGYQLKLDRDGDIAVRDNTAGTIIDVIPCQGGVTLSSPPMGNGIVLSVSNHVLTFTGPAASVVSGKVFGMEE